MWCLYTIECCSAVRRSEIRPCAATWKGLEAITPSEVRGRQASWYHLHVEWQIRHKWNKIRLTDTNNRAGVARGGRGRELGAWVSRRRLLYAEWIKQGPPRWLSGEESTSQGRRPKTAAFDPWVGKIPWRRKWQPVPVLLPGKSQGQRSPSGYSLWGYKGTQLSMICLHKTIYFFFLKKIPKKGFYICITKSLCSTAEIKFMTSETNYTSIFKKELISTHGKFFQKIEENTPQ